MKTTIGGDRLGSGNKQNVSIKNYSRSTHDLGYLWRSSMASGTLVPFMNLPALPGDNFDINLNCEVLTLPTVGPLFGSYKVQLDVFQIPIRLYNAGLHMNKLGIGMDMSKAYLPRLEFKVNNHSNYIQRFEDNEQTSSSSLLRYLGINGAGLVLGATNPAVRYFNAVPLLAYWDIYKNYYANKQEEEGVVVHTKASGYTEFDSANLYNGIVYVDDILDNSISYDVNLDTVLHFKFDTDLEPDPSTIYLLIAGNSVKITSLFKVIHWNESEKRIECTQWNGALSGIKTWEAPTQVVPPLGGTGEQIQLQRFALSGIDDMREDILQYPYASGPFTINENSPVPYKYQFESVGEEQDLKYCYQFIQEGLGLKTYQSDLFNNWIDTEWITGSNGVNEITAVDTSSGEFTIDALNLASKVYVMLNRIAISGGSYDDWLDAVYTHERSKSIESPMYCGSLIKELGFQEVVSNAVAETNNETQPLGTLAGRGSLTSKHKGGKIRIKVDEPSYIIGIASITPRIDYSQGNDWHVNLRTIDDFHKPALDAIGFQDLVTEQMLYTETSVDSSTGVVTYRSAGKQPAWINYMTAVNKVYGNFAEENKDMFMILNRRYEKNLGGGTIADLTTYIDPSKFNHIFAQTSLDSMNFWVQISNDITARRKMSAKVIPNL